jgi:hypothetical protein
MQLVPLRYGCYCSKKGYRAYNNNADGLGGFCKEYWDNERLRQVMWIGGILVSSAMNIVIKLASISLSKMVGLYKLNPI